MIWIIVANSSSCRIFSYDKNPEELSAIKDALNPTDQLLKKFSIVKEFIHPESRLRDVDLSSDNLGRYKTGPMMQSDSFSPQETIKETEIENFAREIVNEIENGIRLKQFSQLILVAPARMIGILHRNFSTKIKSLISHEIQKDYNKLNERELVVALKKELNPIIN